MASDASALANTPRDSSMREERRQRNKRTPQRHILSRSARTKGTTLAGTRSVFFSRHFSKKKLAKQKLEKNWFLD